MADNDMEVQTAFKTKAKEILTLRPNAWAGADSAELVLHCIRAMKDNKGKPVELDEEDIDVITVMSRPTQDGQMRVLHRIFEKHSATLGPKVANRIAGAVNAPTFKMELVKSGVIKDTRANELSDLLA